PGELYVTGVGLARGYWKQPELTAERFIPNPFDSHGTSRLYRTGDLVRCRPDGNIEFLGRIDEQVKIRGYRIETGEIEVALSRHVTVKQCSVIAREARGETNLVAYIVARDGKAIDGGELRRHLEQTLPAYMIPATFVSLEKFPLTANGK